MIINTNMASLNTVRQLGINEKNTQSSLAKLSSGLRINSAADDAAGLSISEKMRGQISGLNQASSNAQNGISLVSTAEGALNETTAVLQRMRELAVSAGNDTNTTTDRAAMQTETNQLVNAINDIGNQTQFNTKTLLNGGAGIQGATYATGTTNALAAGQNVSIAGGAAGVTAGQTLTLTAATAAKTSSITISGTTSAVADQIKTGTSNTTIAINGTSIALGAGSTGTQIAAAINLATGTTGVTAAYTAATAGNAASLVLTSANVGSAADIKLTGVQTTATGAAGDTFVDANGTGAAADQMIMTNTNSGANLLAAGVIAAGTTSDVRGVDAVVTTGAAGVTFTATGNQVTAHGGNVDGLQLNIDATKVGATGCDVNIQANNSLTMQIGANQGQTMNVSISDMRAAALGVSNIDLSSTTSAGAAVTLIDNATAAVSSQRSNLGAFQNRLEHTINNLGTSSQNITSAEANIRDVDMAKEETNFQKSNILQQAAQAMLAQANQQPQGVLQLLR